VTTATPAGGIPRPAETGGPQVISTSAPGIAGQKTALRAMVGRRSTVRFRKNPWSEAKFEQPANKRGPFRGPGRHEVSTVGRSRRAIPGQCPGPFPGGGARGPDHPQRLRRIRRQEADRPGHHRVRTAPARPRRCDVSQAVPPSASVIARSATIFPGSCTARAAFHRSSAAARHRRS
jgi:hypothetical protein